MVTLMARLIKCLGSGQHQNVGVVSLLPEPVNDGEAFQHRQLDIRHKDVVFIALRPTEALFSKGGPYPKHIGGACTLCNRSGELGTLGTTFLEK
jgi:hypothetical protein